MKKSLFMLSFVVLIAGCKKDKSFPVSTKLLVSGIVSRDISTSAISGRQTYYYDSFNRMTLKVDSDISGINKYAYSYNQDGTLREVISSASNPAEDTSFMTYNYKNGLPVGAVYIVHVVNSTPINYVFNTTNNKVSSVILRSDSSTINYSGNNIINVTNYYKGGVESTLNYTFGKHKDPFYYSGAMYYLDQGSQIKQDNEVLEYNYTQSGHSANNQKIQYRYTYNIEGFPVHAIVSFNGTDSGTLDYAYKRVNQ